LVRNIVSSQCGDVGQEVDVFDGQLAGFDLRDVEDIIDDAHEAVDNNPGRKVGMTRIVAPLKKGGGIS
jgi:hypothetical protein